MGKHEFARAFGRRHGEEDDEENEDGGTGPVDAKGVDLVEVFREEDIDEVADEHTRPEAKDCLPLVGNKILVPKRNSTENKLCTSKVDGQGHRPVANKSQPPSDPASDWGPFW